MAHYSLKRSFNTTCAIIFLPNEVLGLAGEPLAGFSILFLILSAITTVRLFLGDGNVAGAEDVHGAEDVGGDLPLASGHPGLSTQKVASFCLPGPQYCEGRRTFPGSPLSDT